tara:strand:- start:13 stop:366 length:354 start_codon:yes stop_codon:yes gene_type:complete
MDQLITFIGMEMLTRRQFFARMRKLGYSKSRFQLTRVGVTYEKEDDDGRVTVTIPKHHESTFHILGDTPNSGIFVEDNGRETNWGIPVTPQDIGFNNMLEVCLGLCSGEVKMSKEQR